MTQVIIYDYVSTPLGRMIVAEFKGKCVLLEFDDRKSLQTIFERKQAQYSARFERGSGEIIKLVDHQLASYFQGELTKFSIPLEYRGTDFQMEVWKALQDIPYGSTISYGRLAKMVDRPLASRAVGNANGANNIAIIIPCHRVVGERGELTGYGGGINRKKQLLQLEAAHLDATTPRIGTYF